MLYAKNKLKNVAYLQKKRCINTKGGKKLLHIHNFVALVLNCEKIIVNNLRNVKILFIFVFAHDDSICPKCRFFWIEIDFKQ